MRPGNTQSLHLAQQILAWAEHSPRAENFDPSFVQELEKILLTGRLLTPGQNEALENIAQRFKVYED